MTTVHEIPISIAGEDFLVTITNRGTVKSVYIYAEGAGWWPISKWHTAYRRINLIKPRLLAHWKEEKQFNKPKRKRSVKT